MLVRLFAKSVLALRGVVTRAANKAAKAQGKPPVRGKLAAKARRLRSAAATLAAAGETVVLPTPGVTVQIASVGATPSGPNGRAATAPPAAQAAPVAPAGAQGNGAMHS